MDKISRIIPSSSRVTSVDMRDAHAMRPGTPLFGRPEGQSALKQNIRTPQFRPEDLTYSNPTDQRNSSIVQDLADNFFGRNRVDATQVQENENNLQPLSYEEPRENSQRGLISMDLQTEEPDSIEQRVETWSPTYEDSSSQGPVFSLPISETEAEYSKGQHFDRMA